MVKKKVINVRLSENEKVFLEKAAKAQGKYLSGFILDAALKEAKQMDFTGQKSYVAEVGPEDFVHNLIKTARTGGGTGYYNAGEDLAKNLDVIHQEKGGSKQSFENLMENYKANDGGEAWNWFDNQHERWAMLIPAQKRNIFGLGFHIGILKNHCPEKDIVITLDSKTGDFNLTTNQSDHIYTDLLVYDGKQLNTDSPNTDSQIRRLNVTVELSNDPHSAMSLMDELTQLKRPFWFVNHFRPINGPYRLLVYYNCRLDRDPKNSTGFNLVGYLDLKMAKK